MRTAAVLLTLALSGCSSLYPFDFAPDGGGLDAGVDAGGVPDAGGADASGADAGDEDAATPPCAAPRSCALVPPAHAAPSEAPCPDGTYRDRDGGCSVRMEPVIGDVCFTFPKPRQRIDCTGTANDRWDALVSALASLGGAGGVIEIGACELEQPLGGDRLSYSGGPLVIEGAGPQQTVIRSTCGACGYPALRLDGGPIALRDLGIEAVGGASREGLAIERAQDVLLERIHVTGVDFGARITRVTNLLAREVELTGSAAGALVISSASEGFHAYTGSRFSATRAAGSAALDIRGVHDVEIAGCELANADQWLRGRSLDRAWIHHVTVTDAGPANLNRCTAATPCLDDPFGDVAFHDLTMSATEPHALETQARDGRVFLLRIDGPPLTVDVRSGLTDIYVCDGEGLTASDATRLRRHDCSDFTSCTTRVFLTP